MYQARFTCSIRQFDSADDFDRISIMDTILLFQPRHSDTMRDIRTGLLDVVREHGLVLQTMKQTMDRRELRKTLDLWKPVGCVIDCSNGNDLAPLDVFDGLPHVCLNLPNRPSLKKQPSFNHDAAPLVKLAARELLSLDCASFAYTPCEADFPWSVERGKLFAREIRKNRKPCAIFSGGSLENWLKSLDLPCGIFAANDEVAQNVSVAAARLGFNVPNDIAIVGVDNNELYCEAMLPGITSIATDHHQAGRQLGELLLKRIAHHDVRIVHEKYGPSQLVRRGSTRKLDKPNPRVHQALEYIRRQACIGPVSVENVAKSMGCSYRLATEEFRASTGRSIVEEVHNVRFAKICELLLSSDKNISDIILACGYNSESFAKHEFGRRYGMTMREYRQQSQPAKAAGR